MAAVPVAPETDLQVVKWHDGRMLSVIEDEWVVDPDTGEVVGSLLELRGEADQGPDQEWCDDMVRRRANAAARLVGLEAQMNMLITGVKDRFEPKLKAERRKLEWLDKGPIRLVIEFALAKVTAKGFKGKSFDFNFGRASFKKSGGKVEIVDQERAVQFCLSHSPKAVKVAIDLNTVPEEVMPKAIELVTLLQNLAPECIAMEARKSYITIPEDVKVPVVKPEHLDMEWEVKPEAGLYDIRVKTDPPTLVEQGLPNQKSALETIGWYTAAEEGIVVTPVSEYEPAGISH